VTDFNFSEKLDLGRGNRPDNVHELEVFPWPFSDEQFEAVYAYDVIGYLPGVFETMAEIWRVLRPDGMLHIRTPHYKDAIACIDPARRHFFSACSFDFWDPGTHYGRVYGHFTNGKKFHIVEKREDERNLYFRMMKLCKEEIAFAV